jgi:hypothetical protein
MMSLIEIASSDSNLVFELIIFLQNNDFQPPYIPQFPCQVKVKGQAMGDFLRLGDTPRPLPEMILGQKEFWTSFSIFTK